jgi:zinc and cadmium transporter
MILTYSFILFMTAFLAGFVAFWLPPSQERYFKLSLTFSGAFLFSITILHLLPELFVQTQFPFRVGLFILLGFFLQLILSAFTSGVEHGHIHTGHHLNATSLLIALCFHSFLEGTLLVHPSDMHGHSDSTSLLFGIVLHNPPAAFALMAVLLENGFRKRKAIWLLLIFALSQPMGLWTSEWLNHNDWVSEEGLNMLFALVAGNFMHISTTIFLESSPQHRFQGEKMFITMLGVLAAVLAEGLK